MTVLAVPATEITGSGVLLVHSTVCPLRFSTVPWPSTPKAYPKASQSQSRISSWRVVDFVIVEPHSPGYGCMIMQED